MIKAKLKRFWWFIVGLLVLVLAWLLPALSNLCSGGVCRP